MLCDLGFVVRRYMKPLMQLMTDHLPRYHMGLLTTKCLNTAATIWYLFLGDKDMGRAWHCDSAEVQTRGRTARARGPRTFAADPANPSIVLDAFRAAVMDASPAVAGRTLFYVILTDAKFRDGAAFFPGHVFVVERNVTARGLARFHVYQSYINQYDLDGHYDRLDKSITMSASEMAGVVADLTHLYTAPTWDARASDFWRRFTHVDGAEFEGLPFAGASYFCYTTVQTDNCLEHLRYFVTDKLAALEAGLQQGRLVPGAIYGDPSKYKPYTQPLTNQQMRDQLRALLAGI